MNCSDIRSELTLFSDGILDEQAASAVSGHLDSCPVCRTELSEINSLRTALRRSTSPPIPADLGIKIKRALRKEAELQKRAWIPMPPDVRAWLRWRIMPYAAGAVASVAVAITVTTLMFSGLRDRSQPSSETQSDTTMLAANRYPFADPDRILPSDYALTRLDVSTESPSVNPQGALIALTKSFVRGKMKDDEVVVVADVFGNGLARITEVVEPSKDREAMYQLEKALAGNDPKYAPFVAANLDKRSDTMRVVLRFQNVDVPTRTRRERR